MKTTASALTLGFFLTGCAGTPPSPSDPAHARPADSTEKIKVVEQGTSEAVVCRYETATGSHRKTRVCRTVDQRDAERESGQSTLRQIQKGGARTNQ